MPTKPRSQIFRPGEQAIGHVMNRCVRKCFLLGYDKQSRKDNRYRRRRFEKELKRAARGFAIDLLSYAILDNHFHLILRTRPDVVKEWSDAKVVRQWHKLCTIFKDKDGKRIPNPSEKLVLKVAQNTEQVAIWRKRLSDISWYMKLVSERIAKWCNALDDITGAFWEGRFKSVLLLDERALLACSMYVDLNRIEAELAASLESSDYTSIQRRIQAEAVRLTMQRMMVETFQTPTSIATTAVIDPNASEIPEATNERERRFPDSHLAPLEIDEKNDPIGAHLSSSGHRCSDKGYLPMSLAKYIELLTWSADQIQHRKHKRAFDDSPPLLAEIQIQPDVWCKLVTQFTDLFYSVAGTPESIDAHKSFDGKRFYMPEATRELLSA